MPISSGGTHEKSSNAGKPDGVLVPKAKKLLSVAPSVLPLLPAVPKPPKLHQRSNTTLSGGVCGLTGDVEIKDNNKDRISLDRRGLTSLPVLAADAQVKLLSLQHNLITRLDNISTIGLSKLVFLDVYDNQLDRIAGLDSLSTLRVLLMGKNRIRRMEGLRSLVRLEVLDLHGNQISQVGGLSTLCELKVLNLAGNQIRTLGVSDLLSLFSLQELNLRRNRIKRLQCFAYPRQFNSFSCDFRIRRMEGLRSLVRLEVLDLHGNQISQVGGLSTLCELKVLNLAGNQIRTLGVSDLLGLCSLQELNLRRNRIKRLQCFAYPRQFYSFSCDFRIRRMEGLRSLVRLEVLDLHGNQISQVGGLSTLCELKVLNLAGNQIRTLGVSDLLGLFSLQELNLRRNRIKRLQCFAYPRQFNSFSCGFRIRRMEGLRSLVRLEVLDLHGNQISQVGGLSTLCELKVLNLAGNQIRTLGVSDLLGLCSLQELNLRRNRIKRLQCFGETPQLQKLFLSNNEIQSIEDMSSVVKATQVREVGVDGNPIALIGDCVSFLVSYLPNLELLSQVQVSEQVRKAAMAWRANKEQTCAAFSHLSAGITLEEESKREEVICNARTNWELLRSQTTKQLLNKHSSSLKDLRSEDILPPQDPLPLSARAVHLPERTDSRRVTYSKKRTVSQQVTEQVRKAAMVWKANKAKSIEREEVISNAREKWETLKSTEIAKSQLSSSLRELRLEEIIPLTQSLPLTGKAVAIPRRVGVKRNLFSKRRALTQVQDPEPLPAAHAESVEFFRLPPILAPLLQNGGGEAGESVSSVEPVADSSLSSLPDESTSDSDTGKGASSKKGSRSSSVSQRKQILTQRTTVTRPKPKPPPNPGKVREQGGDYLVEISGRYLNVYGQGALRFIDRPWNPVKAGDVTHVRFNYVNFNSLSCVLGRLKQRFPNAEHYSFRETNIHCLGQLNALADIQGLTSLMINAEGNPISGKEWRSYAIYRLSHWGLRVINDQEISVEDISTATLEYNGLSELVLWSLPDSLLQPLLSRLRLETTQQSARHWLWSADPALRTVVAKEALQWRRANLSQEDMLWRHKGKAYLGTLLDQACSAIIKLRLLDQQWPAILRELVRDTLVDYSTLDAYMKQCMSSLKL